MKKQTITLSDGGCLELFEGYLTEQHAQQAYQLLSAECAWRQDKIKLFGKEHLIPRQQCFQGESELSYRYSNLILQTEHWHPWVQQIQQQLLLQMGLSFNAVLLNFYRNGQDSMGWHSDDEPELGRNPIIASLSLGQERRFVLRHRFDKQHPKQEVLLQSGSLLIMKGTTQHYWQHSVPRTKKPLNPRINLTFRHIHQTTSDTAEPLV